MILGKICFLFFVFCIQIFLILGQVIDTDKDIISEVNIDDNSDSNFVSHIDDNLIEDSSLLSTEPEQSVESSKNFQVNFFSSRYITPEDVIIRTIKPPNVYLEDLKQPLSLIIIHIDILKPENFLITISNREREVICSKPYNTSTYRVECLFNETSLEAGENKFYVELFLSDTNQKVLEASGIFFYFPHEHFALDLFQLAYENRDRLTALSVLFALANMGIDYFQHRRNIVVPLVSYEENSFGNGDDKYFPKGPTRPPRKQFPPKWKFNPPKLSLSMPKISIKLPQLPQLPQLPSFPSLPQPPPINFKFHPPTISLSEINWREQFQNNKGLVKSLSLIGIGLLLMSGKSISPFLSKTEIKFQKPVIDMNSLFPKLSQFPDVPMVSLDHGPNQPLQESENPIQLDSQLDSASYEISSIPSPNNQIIETSPSSSIKQFKSTWRSIVILTLQAAMISLSRWRKVVEKKNNQPPISKDFLPSEVRNNPIPTITVPSTNMTSTINQPSPSQP